MQLTDNDIGGMFSSKEIAFKFGQPGQLAPPQHSQCNKLEEMPPQIGKLTHLQTLSNLIVGKAVASH
jgi:hypothetical protein